MKWSTWHVCTRIHTYNIFWILHGIKANVGFHFIWQRVCVYVSAIHCGLFCKIGKLKRKLKITNIDFYPKYSLNCIQYYLRTGCTALVHFIQLNIAFVGIFSFWYFWWKAYCDFNQLLNWKIKMFLQIQMHENPKFRKEFSLNYLFDCYFCF